jgi:2-hydroxy-6-oxo-octa-2,4-dienoate hydrolase
VTNLDHWRRNDLVARDTRFAHWSQGEGTPMVLIHGVGPGTTGLANFGPVLDSLAARFEVHLVDLIGLGQSARKVTRPFFDISIWLDQATAVLATLRRPAIVIGNSIGAALALKTTARLPGISHVIAIGAPAAPFPMPEALRRFWSLPTSPETLAAAMRPMTARQTEPAPEAVATRFAAFADTREREYFAAMMEDATEARLREAALTADEAKKIEAAVTIIYGRDDRACPPGLILPGLLPLLPAANVVLLGDCGHNVAAERTSELLAAIEFALRR